ncbi:MAG: hypothetical protein JWP14_952 [Frankiales bacterium]|nr:hypothetical protein [Frankiales bacterium]
MRTQITALAAGALALLSVGGPARATPAQVHFRPAVYLDDALAGSEGFVLYSAVSKRLVYATHEGTTLLYRGGVDGAPSGTGDFLGNYRNQVNLWTSADTGRSWQRLDFHGTGFFTNPAVNTGFSDPDLTTDSAGTIYGAGIDLANDALFSSRDGGLTWPTGTVQCHEGDRPWLAGGRPGEVFLSTDSSTQGHIIVRSTDYGASCSPVSSAAEGSGYYGYGKILLDPVNGSLYQPAVIGSGLGVVELPHAQAAFDSGNPPAFTPHKAVDTTSLNTFWKAVMAIDRAGTLYLVWTTDDRKAGTAGGCSGAATPTANSLLLVSSTDGGHTWSAPRTLAHPGSTVLWPWVVAGDKGEVDVAWYQYDRVSDLDCAPDAAQLRVMSTRLSGLTTSHVSQQVTDVVGRPVHLGQVCTSGTACVATGKDRRLGEFFTLALDARGCVLVATGDTTRTDPVTGGPLPTSRGLFTVQDSGPSLTGKDCGAAATGAGAEPVAGRPKPVAGPAPSAGGLAATGLPWALPAAGVGLLALAANARRRRTRAGMLQG